MQHTDPCSILLVDHDPIHCFRLRDALASRSYHVETAHTGAGALSACAARPFDLLLLDNALPPPGAATLISRLEGIRPQLDILLLASRESHGRMPRPMIDCRGEPPNFSRLLAALDEVSYRKRLEVERQNLLEQLIEKTAELERFNSMVSHDLKNPLITIRGFLGLVKRNLERAHLHRLLPDVRRIQGAVDHLALLLDKLLELSQVDPAPDARSEVSLGVLATKVALFVGRQGGGPSIDLSIPTDPPLVVGNRRQLLEVIESLIENAIKFMGNQDQPRVEVGVRRLGSRVLCYVRDNGMGIERSYQARVFRLFEQLDPSRGGTGMGLAMVKRIVEAHWGHAWVESDGPGKGSTFFFTLPAAR